MGCHTWFSVPYVTDKKEIIKLAQQFIDSCKYLTESSRQMYQYAIDMELITPVCELALGHTNGKHSRSWVLYMDVTDYSLIQYNKEHGTNYKSRYEKAAYEGYDVNALETYSDEPRISGYPDNTIHSFEEMVAFMETGFDDDDGEHHSFYYEESRKESFMNGIKEFFQKHPDGIITFG